jgi:hypothetical protein
VGLVRLREIILCALINVGLDLVALPDRGEAVPNPRLLLDRNSPSVL